MNLLNNITFVICVLSVGYTAVMMLVPDRFRAEIRSVFALAGVVTVVGMAAGADMSELPQKFADFEESGIVSENDRLIQAELEARVGEYLESLLREEGIICKKVSVGTTIDSLRRISITEADIWLDSGYADREGDIKELVRNKIGDIGLNINYEDG